MTDNAPRRLEVEDHQKVWILWWQYADRSNDPQLVRAYGSHARALSDLALVRDDTGRDWALTEVPVQGDRFADGRT
jgi:hypothetical protein